jgi:homoserine O-acetyltransferase
MKLTLKAVVIVQQSIALFIVAFFLAGPIAAAQQAPVDYASRAKEASFIAKDFSFVSGERLQELRINYATWGEPHRNKAGKITNAILLCHGTMGSWRAFASWWAAHMFGPGQPLDTGKYFVIASDCIGAGKSSKPSDGLGMNFPKYRLADVVHAQKRLLAEALDVQELVAVIGISYGGRQTWQWGVQYPEAMRGLVPLISSPFPNAGRRGMQDFLPAEAITSDPTWNNGAYKEQPRNFPLAVMMFWLTLDGAGHLWEVAPTREQSFTYLPEATKQQVRSWDANDFLYQMHVNDGFDAYRDLDRVKARVLMINMAGDGLVPTELGHAEKVVEKLGPKADYLLVRESYGYGHLAVSQTAVVYGPKIGEFLQRLANNSAVQNAASSPARLNRVAGGFSPLHTTLHTGPHQAIR